MPRANLILQGRMSRACDGFNLVYQTHALKGGAVDHCFRQRLTMGPDQPEQEPEFCTLRLLIVAVERPMPAVAAQRR